MLASRLYKALIPIFGVSLAVLVSGPSAAVNAHARRANNAQLGISVEVPSGWVLSQRTGYSEMIFLLTHPDGSRISLSAQKALGAKASDILAQNKAGLAKQGFTENAAPRERGEWLVLDMDAPGNEKRLRQFYLLRKTAGAAQALVLTLVSPAKFFTPHLTDIDFFIERMSLDDTAIAPRSDEGRDALGGRSGKKTANGGSTSKDSSQP